MLLCIQNFLIFTGGGIDYDSGPFSVTLPAGQTIVPVNVLIIDDKIFEPDEEFILSIQLNQSTGLPLVANRQNPQTVIKINDNDCKFLSF